MKKLSISQLGIHPINWAGEDVLEHGDDYTGEEILADIHALGFTKTEISRKFPNNVVDLKQLLQKYNIELTTQFKGVHFSQKGNLQKELDSYEKHCKFLAELNCDVVSTVEVGGSILNQDPTRGEDEVEVQRLNEHQWHLVLEGLQKAGAIAKRYSLDLVYHPHAGTVIENKTDVDRLMRETSPELVSLLLDSGHSIYGNIDPVELMQDYAERVKYIHLKDVRLSILNQVRGKYGIRDCIRKGMFTVPGSGNYDFSSLFDEIAKNEYQGWLIIEGEQDPEMYNPLEYAKMSKKYIESLIAQKCSASQEMK